MNTTLTFTHNTLYRLLNIAVVYGIVVMISKLAGVQGYGLLSLMIVNATFFNLVSGFGADAGITYHSANANLQPGKLLTIIFIIIALQCMMLGVAEFFYHYFTGASWIFKSKAAVYWWIGFVCLLSISLTEKYSSLFNGNYLFVLYSKIIFWSNLLVLLSLSLIFFYLPAQKFITIIIVYVVLYLLQSLVLIIVFHRRVNVSWRFSSVSKKDIQVFLSFSVITLAANFIQFLCYRMDFWFIEYYRGPKELGWYAFAVRLVQAFWILPVLFAGILFTQVAKKKQSFKPENMLFFMRMLFILNVLAGLFCFFCIQVFVPLIFGNVFNEAILPFKMLLPGIILFCYTTVLAAYFSGNGFLRINLTGSIICFVVILVTDIFLIPLYGMKGAAVASSIGYTVSCIYSVSVYCKQTGTPLYRLFYPEKSDWSDLKNAVSRIITKKIQ